MKNQKSIINNRKPARQGMQGIAVKSIVIGWLYPRLMNTYGDMGNVTVLLKRSLWRDIKAEVKNLNPGFSETELKSCDILLMGGAQDKQQEIVNNDLKKHKKSLSEMIEKGIPGLFVCGGFQFLGKYYKDSDGNIIEGLGIFDLHTINPGPKTPRLIGNVAIQSSILGYDSIFIGFENHGGRTYLGQKLKSFGNVMIGNGNNGEDKSEGAIYKNTIGTYLHGPILPKNPKLADFLLSKALGLDKLEPLDDELETNAQSSIAKRLGVAI